MKKRILSFVLALVMAMTMLPTKGITAFAAADQTINSGPVELKLVSGSGDTYVYHNFQETLTFSNGEKYAFLDGIYSEKDAISKLGSGAVLEVTSENNSSERYITGVYGEDAQVAVYVNVIQKGAGFDWCEIGGLYKVPNTSAPTEYRYFCAYGGAQDCGPLYAYHYTRESVGYGGVTCTLNDIANLGSLDPAHYTVQIAYGAESEQYITLAPNSYTISETGKDGEIAVTTADDEGNEIQAVFTTPMKLSYAPNDASNAYKAQNLPAFQGAWAGSTVTISGTVPTRETYQFVNYSGSDGNTYSAGDELTLNSNVTLTANWKDVTPPVVSAGTTSLMTRATEEAIKKAVQEVLTYTDNEPISECVVSFPGFDPAISKKAGTKKVKAVITDKAGNAAAIDVSVTFNAGPLEINDVKFMESGNQLEAVLYEAGPDPITETGFVWGVMQNPTLTLNNGTVKTAQAVTEPDGLIRVTANNLEKGVNYYARAYAKAGDSTYYSAQINFGMDAPQYGAFTISGPDSVSSSGTVKFTISRSGSSGEQTVYYRTLNGSAVGGTHFTHTAGALVFADGETSKTVSVSVKTANTMYGSYTATAYTNTDREFQMEIYNVVGGAALGSTTKATCTLVASDTYKVQESVYNKNITSKTSEDTVYATEGFAGIQTVTLSNYYTTKEKEYLTALGLKLRYTVQFQAAEVDDGYQSIQVAKGSSVDNDSVDAKEKSITMSNTNGNAQFAAMFEHDPGNKKTTYYTYNFPAFSCSNSDSESGGVLRTELYAKGQNKSNGYLVFDLSETHITLGADASGSGSDNWNIKNAQQTVWVADTAEPKLLAVAPTAGNTTFRKGDTFTISLIFDEIVDSGNTTTAELNKLTVDTTWGTAAYSGGADSNVLYFTGTVKNDADGELKLKNTSNLSALRDMCSTEATKTSVSEQSAGGNVNTQSPNYTLTAMGVSAGIGSVKIVVGENKDHTSSVRYAWSGSSAMPASGWVALSAGELAAAKTADGFIIRTRQEPGSGNNGKWYLHTLATYDVTQYTEYKSQMVDFGTVSRPTTTTPEATLTVSTDNTNWAASRTITVNTTGTGTLSYRLSSAAAYKTVNVVNGRAAVTVRSNGTYVFRMVTADDTIIQSVEVSKIDSVAPVAVIKALDQANSAATAKPGVYTSISVPFAVSDGGSGVQTLQYAWTDSAAAPASWETADVTAASLTYTAAQTAETDIYLHLKITDKVGNTIVTTSPAYQVISKTAVENHTPKITVTGGINAWTNDMPTLTWRVSHNAGKNFIVTLPNGRTTSNTSGKFLATQNATFTFSVEDLDYGGVNSDSITISYLDIDAPTVTVSGITGDTQVGKQTITLQFADTQSGVKGGRYAITDDNTNVPTDGFVSFTGSKAEVPIQGNGTYYIYYEAYDNAGGTVADALGEPIERPSNKISGFTAPISLHTHQYTYKAEDNVITESCTCGHSATAVVSAPAGTLTYNGKTEFRAALKCSDGFIAQQPSIHYERDGSPTTDLKGAGRYTASITVNGKTASVAYKVEKAVPVTAFPQGLGISAGQKLADISGIPTGYSWDNGSAVVAYGTNEYPMTFTPADTANYKSVQQAVLVEGYDKTAPAGEIRIKNNGWKQFFNTVTFGLFFKDYVEVEITGTDAESGIAAIEYCLCDTAKNAETIGSVTTWMTYTGKVRIDASRKVFVYAKLTDKKGNVAYLSADRGVVVYQDARQDTQRVTYTLTTKQDMGIEITHRSNGIESVSLGNTVLTPGVHYKVIDMGEGKLRIDMLGAYLDTLAVGEYAFTVAYKPMGESYVEAAGNEAPNTTTFTVRVEKNKIAKPQADTTNFIYSGNEHTYAIAASAFYTVAGDAQTDAGAYTVTVAIKDEYKTQVTWADGSTDDLYYEFVISKAKVAPPAINSKVYNGSNQTADVSPNSLYTVAVNAGGSDVGSYPVVLKLRDGNNYKWDAATGINGDEITLAFQITKATNVWTIIPAIEDWTYGQAPSTPKGTATYGVVEFVYYDSDQAALTEQPTNAGDYYMSASVAADGDNYDAISTELIAFTVAKADLTVTANQHSITYGEAPANNGVTYRGFVNGEDEDVLDGELSYDYSYRQYDDVGRGYTIKPKGLTADNYTIHFAEGKLTVEQLETEIVWSTLSADDLVYDGSAKTLSATLANQQNVDDVSLILALAGENVNVSEEGFYYKITALEGDKAGNYKLGADLDSPTYKITKGVPVTSFPIGLNIATGKKLSEVTLPDGYERYQWDAPDTVVKYDTNEYAMTFTPADTDNYSTVTQMVPVIGHDVTAPTGSITIDEDSWAQFWNDLTFGLFFKETQQVTVTAEDTESGVNKTEYYLASAETDNFTDVQWTEFTNTFNIAPNNRYVVYVKITDNAENSIIINSDGVVLDDIKPVLVGIENGKTYHKVAEVTVTDENLDRVEINGEETTPVNGKVTISAAAGEQKVMAFDKAGNVSAEITITVEAEHSFAWGEWYDRNDGTHSKDAHCACGADLTITAPKQEADVVDGLEEESELQGKDLHLIVETDVENIDGNTIVAIEAKLAEGISAEYIDITVKDVIGNVNVTDTTSVFEIPVVFDFTGKLNITVYRNHEGEVENLKALEARPAENFRDGTYYPDRENGVIYIYSNQFSTYGVAYHIHNLLYVPEKAASREADGNIEYWYCEGCGRYFKDAEGENEIIESETVLKYNNSPETGDRTDILLWEALMLVSVLAGITILAINKRKRDMI